MGTSGYELTVMQCCHLSRIIQEPPDFGPYLPVSRLESDLSWMIAKVALSVDSITGLLITVLFLFFFEKSVLKTTEYLQVHNCQSEQIVFYSNLKFTLDL